MVAFTVHPPTHTRWLSDADIHASTDLTGKTALVTGATSGLGRAAATALARRGARVMLGVRNVEAGARIAAAIEAETGCAPGTVTVGPPLDLASNESVRSFAEDVVGKCPRLDLLVNNAGVNFIPKAFTPEGVGVIAQVNFLGPAALTRALEAPILAAAAHAGVANVVHVSSVTHRYASIPSVRRFLTQWDAGSYAATKLANVLFAYECHRRWGAAGVRSAAVDPGAIYSNLWDNDRVFSSPPMRAVLGLTYAPPEDGVAAVVTASLAPFHEATKREGAGDGDGDAATRLRFYARGLFASRLVAGCAPGLRDEVNDGLVRSASWHLNYYAWGIATLAVSMLDWPVRACSRGRFAGRTAEVRSSPASYDEATASELWEEAGAAASRVSRGKEMLVG
jgi:NAD(P)-dependent dehydrogenase (short-subunit alcohol dehydrogenase family)